MINKLDAIIVDFKESIEDFGHEVKNIIDRTHKMEKKIKKLEDDLQKLREIALDRHKEDK